MRKNLSIASWALFIIVTPLTFLGIIAQNTIPGDFLYSIKRTYEGGALLALSVFPSAKADYNTNLASTRYTEAEKLIVKKSDTQGLTALVAQVQQAKQDIANVSDQKQKEELQQKLVTSITQYQQGLNVVAAQVATQNSIAYTPSSIETQTTTQNTAYAPPQQTGQQAYQNQPAQNNNPQQNFPSQSNQFPPQQQPAYQNPPQNPPSGRQQHPTPTQAEPQPTNPPSGPGSNPTDIIKTIQDTQDTLNTLKHQVQQSQMMQITPTPTFIPPTVPPTHPPIPTYYYAPTHPVEPTESPSHKKEKSEPKNEPGSNPNN